MALVLLVLQSQKELRKELGPSRYNGAAALIRSDFPLAIYTHCASHRLNLCVAGACKIPMIRKMFGIVKAVHDFFNWPKHNEKLKESIEENFEDKGP